MRIVQAGILPIFLGSRGEHLATRVYFSPAGWEDSPGEGEFSLAVLRPEDTEPYSVAVTREGDEVYWDPTAADTAQAGIGRCELRCTVGDTPAKSKVWLTRVAPSLGDAGESPELPPVNPGSGGGGGTTDYTALSNKPSLNGVALSGGKSAAHLGISYDDLADRPVIHDLPAGGAAGQVLAEASAADHDAAWANPAPGVPTGTVIYYAGLNAPEGYLSCDGTVYNISDYPDLAAFFETNYGDANYWGGDGTATFAVPDWRGEFLRASGTNAHANQGSGAAVGAHPDGTTVPNIAIDNRDSVSRLAFYPDSGSTFTVVRKADFTSIDGGGTISLQRLDRDSTQTTTATGNIYTSRPTNTGLPVCIKT